MHNMGFNHYFTLAIRKKADFPYTTKLSFKR